MMRGRRKTVLFRLAACAYVVIPLIGFAAEPAAESDPDRRFSVQRTDEGVLVSEGDRKVLFYQRQPKALDDGSYRRANYVHPLYDLDGRELTEDFPPDHPHQRGIYWAWHQFSVGGRSAGDPWVCKDVITKVDSVEVKQADDGASLSLNVHGMWMSSALADPAGKPVPVIDERTIIRVHAARPEYRLIDFEIRLQAKLADVRLGGSEDEKGYGGFSARVRLPKGLTFTGSKGEVEPRMNQVEAGPWVSLAAEDWALAILTHPSSPGYPQPWILRRAKSMQNPVYPGPEPVVVPQDEPLVLRYRVVVHRGLERAALEQLQLEYGR